MKWMIKNAIMFLIALRNLERRRDLGSIYLAIHCHTEDIADNMPYFDI